jgi:microcystin degradation protein MlrC
MVVEAVDDPESDLAGAVREVAGSIPLAVVLDLHGNPGEGLVEAADVVVAYETYPHVDAAERAADAVALLQDAIAGELAPAVAGRRVPVLSCPPAQATGEEPMRSLLAEARRLRARPGVAAVALLPGYAYADVERLGFGVLVTGAAPVVDETAEELAGLVWERRDRFRPDLLSPKAGIERALAAAGPVVLADVGDNVGGGAPGDRTDLVGALLEAGAGGAVAVLHAPAAAREAAEAGTGATVEAVAGDPPLPLRGVVRFAGRLAYRRSGSYMTGQAVDLGDCAVVDVGGVEVLLTSRRAMPFDPDHLRLAGIEPGERRVLVAKSAVAWRAAFGDVATEAIAVDTSGVTTCRLETLPYERRPHPLWPLDEV